VFGAAPEDRRLNTKDIRYEKKGNWGKNLFRGMGKYRKNTGKGQSGLTTISLGGKEGTIGCEASRIAERLFLTSTGRGGQAWSHLTFRKVEESAFKPFEV